MDALGFLDNDTIINWDVILSTNIKSTNGVEKGEYK